MRKYLIFFLIISSYNIEAQQYEFINEVLAPANKDTLYLKDFFLDVQKYGIHEFNEQSVRDWWYPLPISSPKIPTIKPFLDNFNLNHLNADLLTNRNDTIIDFSQLSSFFYKSNSKDEKLYRKRSYITISKPFFNCSKNWCVMIFSSYMPYANAGGGGVMNVYRKINNKWVLYHRVELWMS